jgi:PAS domain S-box-containing protein
VPTDLNQSSSTHTIEIIETSAPDPRHHLAAIVDYSDDPIISKRLDGTIMSWNSAATRVFGYQPDEIIGKSILSLIPPELQHEEAEIIRKLRAGERIDHYETVRMRKNGERFPISVTISPIRDEAGNVVAASKIAHDISERRKEDESRYRLAALVDSADDAIISKDLNGIVQSWNRAAEAIFGYTAEEMIGQSILRVIPDNLQYEEEEILSKLRAGQRVEHHETTRRKKSGELFQISASISPIFDQNRKVIGASKIARDISDRKRVEKLLIQSEKLAATGRMAAAIAHEINNPLEALVNIIFLARQQSPPDSRINQLLATAEQELERVSHIARQTLGYYKDTGAPSEVRIHDLLENVLTVYNSKMLSNCISVDSRFNDIKKITVSRGEILQVLSNVVANAIDSMKHGGVLTISTRNVVSPAQDGIETVIRDTGTGIAADNLPRVFEPFFTTKGILGTGIGLWVAKQLVTRRGGQITITSSTTPRNSGTTVAIFLPFVLPPSSSVAESNELL